MDYLHKIEKVEGEDLLWNIPEQKLGIVNVIGGNLQNFRTPVKVTEFLATSYPFEKTNLVLPDTLKTKLPSLDNLVFLKSTDSGSFADGEELLSKMDQADFNLLIGDLSRNAITGKAVQSACHLSAKPTLITRNTVDIIADGQAERILMNSNLMIMGSVVQLQKLFKAVYYPKMLMPSQSLVQVAEALHKFTLSYPIGLITLHDVQIIVAQNGIVNVLPLKNTSYSPITIWDGMLASKIVALNLYNPNNFLEATLVATK